jgi:hypothetical protein
MRKIHDWRPIKDRHAYKARELADLLNIGECAVYRWLHRGLRQLGTGRPALILGSDAIEFIQKLHKSYKRPCAPGQLHCLRCRTARGVANNTAQLIPHTKGRAYLKAACCECGCGMCQIVRLDKLPARMPGITFNTKSA